MPAEHVGDHVGEFQIVFFFNVTKVERWLRNNRRKYQSCARCQLKLHSGDQVGAFLIFILFFSAANVGG